MIKTITQVVPKLEGLDLERTNGDTLIEGYQFLQDIAGLKELKRLCVGNTENYVLSEHYQPLAGLEKLEHLDVSSSPVDDNFLANVVRSSPNMKFLVVGRTEVTDQGIRSISKLEFLRHLDLSNSKISDHALRHV